MSELSSSSKTATPSGPRTDPFGGALPELPYPGLRPFESDESVIFFGRREQVSQLLAKLGGTRFVAVIGTSGCGKSSLLRAGLVPALEAGFMTAAGARWRIAMMRPGNQPRRELAAALIRDAGLRSDEPNTLPLLVATLSRGPLGLIEAVNETPLPDQRKLLVIVDQFEEIFRYREQGNRKAADEADAFVRLLLETSQAGGKDADVYLVIAMRSDFLGDCAVFAGLPEAINASAFLVPRLARDQREAAIVRPARICLGEVDQTLVTRLLNDMTADPDQLPLLQHALMRMWTLASQERTADAPSEPPLVTLQVRHYEDERIHGLSEALSLHADEAYGDLTGDEARRIAAVLFRSLTGAGRGRRDIRNPTPLGEVARVAQVPWQEVAAVVEVFRRRDRSFLVPPVNRPLDEYSMLDISHESLIREWKRLRDWAAAEAASAEMYRDLVRDSSRWKSRKTGFLVPPELDLVLKWKASENPTVDWARRYDEQPGEFALAMEFLEASSLERDRLARVKEDEALDQHRREVEQARLDEQRRQDTLARARELEQGARELEQAKASKRKIACIAVLAWCFAVAAVLGWIFALSEISVLGSKSLGQRSALHTRLGVLDLGLLVAVEAMHRANTPAALNSLVSSVLAADSSGFQRMYAVPGTTAPDAVSLSTISADARWLARTDKDNSVAVWELGNAAGPTWRCRPLSRVTALTLSRDGRVLASGHADGTVALWDVLKQGEHKAREEFKGTAEVTSLTFGSTANVIAAGRVDGTLAVFRAGRPLILEPPLQPGVGPVRGLAFNAAGDRLAAGRCSESSEQGACMGGIVNLFALEGESLTLFRSERGHKGPVVSLALSGRNLLITGGGDGTVVAWNLALPPAIAVAPPNNASRPLREDGQNDRQKQMPFPVGSTAAIETLSLSPSSTLLVAGRRDGTSVAWRLDRNPQTGSIDGDILSPQQHPGPVSSVAFLADGKTIVSATSEGTVLWWGPRLDQRPKRVPDNPHLVFSADGKFAAQVKSHEVRLWDHSTNPQGSPTSGPAGSAQNTAPIELWRPVPSKEVNDRPLRPAGFPADDEVSAIGFATLDAESLLVGTGSGSMSILNMSQGDLQPLPRLNGPVVAVASNDTLKRFAYGGCSNPSCTKGEIRVHQLAGREEDRSLSVGGSGVSALVFSGTGAHLASGSEDGNVILWNLPDVGNVKQGVQATGVKLGVHSEPVRSLAFSYDGATVTIAAGGGKQGKIMLWIFDTHAGVVRRTISLPLVHHGAVLSLAFSPDGKMMASGDLNTSVVLWDVESQQPFNEVLRLHDAPVTRVAFSKSGDSLISGALDNKVVLLSLTPHLWTRRACSIAKRNPRQEEWTAEIGSIVGYRRVCLDVADGMDMPWWQKAWQDFLSVLRQFKII